ncbi:hypothetical protein [Acidiplasma cupricumulans]|nr:hypothetical protein [Acidiplasma cupricumulans]
MEQGSAYGYNEFYGKNFAIMETAAHLIYMENSGIIRGIEKNGIKYYSL